LNGILPWLVSSLALSCRYKRFLFWLQWLGCDCQPSRKYFFLTVHRILNPLSPSSSKLGTRAGSRAGSPVSLYVSLIRHWCLVSSFVIVSYGPCHKVFNIFYVLIKRLNLIFAVLIIFGCILKIVCHFLKVYFASIYMYSVVFCEYLRVIYFIFILYLFF